MGASLTLYGASYKGGQLEKCPLDYLFIHNSFMLHYIPSVIPLHTYCSTLLSHLPLISVLYFISKHFLE